LRKLGSIHILSRYMFKFFERFSPKLMINIYSLFINHILRCKVYKPNLINSYLARFEITKTFVVGLLSRYYSLSYSLHFLEFNLRKAYADKVMLNILMYNVYPYKSKEHRESRSYLALMMTNDMCLFLADDIDGIKEYIDSSNIALYNARLWRNYRKYKLKKIKKLYVFGPLSDYNDCLKYSDRELILFKPYQLNNNNYHGKVNLFLNQNFSNKRESDFVSISNNPYYKSIYVRIAPKFLLNDLNKVRIIKESDRYPGLLALNRMLHNYYSDNISLDISVTGISFYLSEYKYSNIYENIAKKEGYKRNKKHLMSIILHDLLMNFMFTKRQFECGIYKLTDSVEFKNIIDMSVSDYCDKFVEFNSISA
jgi:hypothetical protein